MISVNFLVFSALALTGISFACNAWNEGLPTPTGTVSSSAVIEIAAGATFDGGWKKYDRGSGACNDQSEGDWEDAVFYLHEGATLQNVIIGKNQAEGIHCTGHCYLNYVWFEDVCEDAISIKNDSMYSATLDFVFDAQPAISITEAGTESWIVGGGAYHAEDKVVQHNGCGTVNIINFYVEDYGKLYRSCGNCSSQCKRNVYIEGVEAVDGGTLAGINYNYGDTATIKDACYDTSHPCTLYDGNDDGDEPSVIGYCSG